jgi:hypothetical protein
MYAVDNNIHIHFLIRNNYQHIYIRLALKYRQNNCKIVNKKLWQTKLKVINLDHIITDTFNRMITITEHNFLPNLIKMSFGHLKFDWI